MNEYSATKKKHFCPDRLDITLLHTTKLKENGRTILYNALRGLHSIGL